MPALASSNSPKYEPADVYEPYEPAVGRPAWPNDPRRTIDSGVGVVPGVPGGVVLGVLFPLMRRLFGSSDFDDLFKINNPESGRKAE